MKTFLYIFIICVSFCFTAEGQQINQPVISGDFKDVAVNTFLKQLQALTNYHFYYDTAHLDSIKINLSVKDQSLKTVLEKAFENTNIYYAIDRHNNVFISKGLAVQTTLPEGFFSGKINDKDAFASKTGIDLTYDTTKGINSTTENKLYVIGESAGNNASSFT